MKSLLSVLVVFLTLSCQNKPETENTPQNIEEMAGTETLDNPFIHHVYFYLKNPESMEDREKLVEGLNKLAKVETIQKHFIGFPASTNRDVIVKDYSVSWMCFFNNIEEEEMYQVDPIHLKFVEEYSHLWSTVKVYDSIK
jgi:hypothetical protein